MYCCDLGHNSDVTSCSQKLFDQNIRTSFRRQLKQLTKLD